MGSLRWGVLAGLVEGGREQDGWSFLFQKLPPPPSAVDRVQAGSFGWGRGVASNIHGCPGSAGPQAAGQRY